MSEREKVAKGLEVCRDQDNPPGYRFTSCVDDCPYHGNGCARKLKEDALALLKEQETVVRCKDCKHGIIHGIDVECVAHEEVGYDPEPWHPLEWYCADGEAKE